MEHVQSMYLMSRGVGSLVGSSRRQAEVWSSLVTNTTVGVVEDACTFETGTRQVAFQVPTYRTDN